MITKTARPQLNRLQNLRKQAESFLLSNPKAMQENSLEIYELLHELSVYQVELELQNEELQHAQAALAESRDYYVDLYEFAPVSYITMNNSFTIVSCNFAAAELLGYERGYILQRNFINFVPAFYQSLFAQGINKLYHTQKKSVFELELLKKSNEHCFVRIESILSSKQQIRISVTDITHNKQMELQLKEANQSLCLINHLFQSASDAIAAIDQEYKVSITNSAFQHIFAKLFDCKIDPRHSLINLLADNPIQQHEITNACQKAREGKESTILHEVTTNTAYQCYEFKFSTILDADYHCVGVNFLIRDITEYKLNERKKYKRQAEIAYAARINALGEVASALAHEINQPLTAITTYSHGCILRLEKGIKDAQDYLQILHRISSNAKHAGEVVHRMKNFMREGKLYYESVYINELIKDTFEFLYEEENTKPVYMQFKLAPNIPVLSIDRIQIAQVIINIARNSIEALHNANIANPQITIQSYYDSDWVFVDIIDNGPGIAPEVAHKILTSYFTTKAQGTGLGLSICRTLIEAHGGKLIFKANYTGGAWFQFALPIHKMQV